MASLKRILVGALLGSAAAFGYLLFSGGFLPFVDSELEVPSTYAITREAGEPSRLMVPALGIDAPVEKVGVNARGDMAVPRRFAEVGWYRHGARPGEKGSAVMAGHVDNGLTIDGVFKNLDGIKEGESIIIETEQGEELRFVVEEIAVYPYADVPLEKLFNREDRARLNLVTCSGSWIPSQRMYSERLVVYATLVGS